MNFATNIRHKNRKVQKGSAPTRIWTSSPESKSQFTTVYHKWLTLTEMKRKSDFFFLNWESAYYFKCSPYFKKQPPRVGHVSLRARTEQKSVTSSWDRSENVTLLKQNSLSDQTSDKNSFSVALYKPPVCPGFSRKAKAAHHRQISQTVWKQVDFLWIWVWNRAVFYPWPSGVWHRLSLSFFNKYLNHQIFVLDFSQKKK